VWNHTGIPAQGSEYRKDNDDFHIINSNSLKNQQKEILPKTVRTLPNMVSFSLPTNRSTRLSYQDSNQIYNFDIEFWNRFEEYLKNIYRKSSVKPRFLYAKQYHQVLLEGNAQSLVVLPNDKRLQVMKALSILSKFIGCYDAWKNIKDRYQLKWSDENSVDTFKKIINEDNSFNSLLEWLKNTSWQISETHRNILFYCTLTGLRPDEACQSIRLVKENINHYLDRDKMILKHFEFPDIFIRRTKQAYVSIANDLIINVANSSGSHSYNALRCHLRRKNIAMNMN
jgi:hypothetical protein